jgi:hypothetical protein
VISVGGELGGLVRRRGLQPLRCGTGIVLTFIGARGEDHLSAPSLARRENMSACAALPHARHLVASAVGALGGRLNQVRHSQYSRRRGQLGRGRRADNRWMGKGRLGLDLVCVGPRPSILKRTTAIGTSHSSADVGR